MKRMSLGNVNMVTNNNDGFQEDICIFFYMKTIEVVFLISAFSTCYPACLKRYH